MSSRRIGFPFRRSGTVQARPFVRLSYKGAGVTLSLEIIYPKSEVVRSRFSMKMSSTIMSQKDFTRSFLYCRKISFSRNTRSNWFKSMISVSSYELYKVRRKTSKVISFVCSGTKFLQHNTRKSSHVPKKVSRTGNSSNFII